MKSTYFSHTYCQWSLALLGRSNFTYSSKVISTLWSNLTSFPELLHLLTWSQTTLHEKVLFEFFYFF